MNKKRAWKKEDKKAVYFKNCKKAVSPMIATILLIMIVLVLAMIILLWSRGFFKELVTKEIAGSEKRVNELCLEIEINPIINEDGSFGFENIGNVPIYAYNLKLTRGGRSDIVEISNEEGGRSNPGSTVLVKDYNSRDYDSIEIIPFLLGKSEKTKQANEFQCPESRALHIK